MLNEIICGIALVIGQFFGDNFEIYNENVKQGFEYPCFFIKFLKSTRKDYLGTRHKRTYHFDIHYFSDKGNTDMYGVLDQLKELLKFITLPNGDVLKGSDIDGEIIDDVLHVNVSFAVMMISDVERTENMNSYQLLVKTEGEEHGNNKKNSG